MENIIVIYITSGENCCLQNELVIVDRDMYCKMSVRLFSKAQPRRTMHHEFYNTYQGQQNTNEFCNQQFATSHVFNFTSDMVRKCSEVLRQCSENHLSHRTRI